MDTGSGVSSAVCVGKRSNGTQVGASGLHRGCNLISRSSCILIRDFSSMSLDDAKSHRACNLEIEILAASRQKCLQDSIRKGSCAHY